MAGERKILKLACPRRRYELDACQPVGRVLMPFQTITAPPGKTSDDSAAIPGTFDCAEVPFWENVLVDQDARSASRYVN